jgi:hypothetical protein
MSKTLMACAHGALAAGLVGISGAEAAPEGEVSTPLEAIAAGKPILEVRSRYEHWDQTKTATLTQNGQALTVRARVGWETAAFHDVTGLVDFDVTRWLGPQRFAISSGSGAPLNGADKARYPIINDPEVTELNRLQLTWAPSRAAQVTVGRQRIAFDDSRFVGAAPWRMDEQTFDAVRADVSRGRFKATYAYVAKVNRTLGEAADWDSDSHFLNAGWTFSDALRVQGFVYAFDFEQAPASSMISKGARVSGKAKAGPYGLAYSATFARQNDWRGKTAPFELDYFGADVAATGGIYTVRLGYDALEGNGQRGFGSAIGAAHGVNGWADAWSSAGGIKNFADGLQDANVTLTVKPKWRWLPARSELMARYHDFDDYRTNVDLGHEWNLSWIAPVTQKLTFQWKYADFDRVKSVPKGALAPPASRTKWWLILEYKL